MIPKIFYYIRGGARSPEAVMESLAPIIWFRADETTGTTAVNYGSAGSGSNGTIVSTTLLNQSAIGGLKAWDFDGATSAVEGIARPASLQNPTVVTIMGLTYVRSLGEVQNGHLWATGTTPMLYHTSTTSYRYAFAGARNWSSGNVYAESNNNAWALNEWFLVFGTYNHNDLASLPQIWIGRNGAPVTEVAGYVKQNRGSIMAANTNAFLIGNTTAYNRTVDGLISYTAIWDRVLTLSEMDSIRSAIW